MTGVTQTDRADALIARIETETAQELARIEAEAAAGVAAILRAAHRRARDRVHREIEALRRQRAEALRHEAARLDTARRQLRQREAGAEIDAGLPAVAAALEALWADTATRHAWVRAALRRARARLGPGDWTIEHPKGWPAEERRALAAEIAAATGRAPDFQADPALAAGLRIRAGSAWLDAGNGALLADTSAIGAALLAEVARDRTGAP